MESTKEKFEDQGQFGKEVESEMRKNLKRHRTHLELWIRTGDGLYWLMLIDYSPTLLGFNEAQSSNII